MWATGLSREEQNKFSKKCFPVGIESETLGLRNLLCHTLMSSWLS